MANIVKNIQGLGPLKGTVETVRDLFGVGEHAVGATFKVTDANGETQEVSNAEATPIYKTPTGYSNTRSYAYLTPGSDGKMTLNVSKDLLESDSFKKNYLENSTFKEVLNMYNANKNANTVIATTDEEGNVKNQTLQELVDGYNTALGEFASAYEGYSLMRDNIKSYTGFDFNDDEIRLAANTISADDKNSDTGVIYLPDDWLSIYDFSKMSSYDPETKSISTKDFFDAYNLDKDGGISEDQWNELKASANGIVSSAYSGNMKSNIDEDAGGDAEVTANAKDRLARAIQANNLLSSYDPEQSFMRTAGIVASNTVLTLGNKNAQFLNKLGEASALAAEGWHIMLDYGVAAIKDATQAKTVISGATYEDLADGTVNANNYREYINGILVSATDGSQSEVDRVTAEWKAKIAASDTLSQFFGESTENKLNQLDEAVKWHQSYTREIAPKAASAGKFMGELIFLAEEVYFANKLGEFVSEGVYPAQATYKSLYSAFKNGTSTSARLAALYEMAIKKPLAFAANMSTQAVVDTLAFEDKETFLNAWQKMDPGAQNTLTEAFAENFAGNVVAEAIGLGGSAIGGKITASENPVAQWISTRATKIANAASIPKKSMQIKFAESKLGRFLQKPIGKSARTNADMALKLAKEEFGEFTKAQTLEEWNIEKAKIELEATRGVAAAKKGAEYVTDFEKNTIKKAETTTEAIMGKTVEKANFLNQASRITEGIKTYQAEILADKAISSAYRNVTDAAADMQRVLKWADYNPAGYRFMSQDSANYIINKNHYDNLIAKQDMLKAIEEELDAKKAAKLAELDAWLRNFRTTHSEEALSALDNMVIAEQKMNKALTDWQVKHNIMSSEKYERMIASGMFGASDEKYVRAIAMPEGKTMFDASDEERVALRRKFEERLADDTGYYTGTRDVDYEFDDDFNLTGTIADNYLDPILVNSLTVEAMAKAYQGRMWYNSLTSIKAPVREWSMDGKPATRREINNVMNRAKSAASDAIKNLSSEDLLGNTGETMGLAYRDSRLVNYHKEGKPTDKVKDAKAKIDKILGVDSDAKVYTNVGGLDLAQTKSVISTFGPDAPVYGKVKNNAELKAQFDSLSPAQQEQALKAMGSKDAAIDVVKTKKVEQNNPEYAEWKKEKKAFEAEQNKLKKAFDAEQNRLERAFNAEQKKAGRAKEKAVKKAGKKAEKQLYGGLFNDLRDASLDQYKFDVKDGVEVDSDYASKMVSKERSVEVEEALREDFNYDEFVKRRDELENLIDAGAIKRAEMQKTLVDEFMDPDYVKNAKAEYSVGEETVEEAPAKFERKEFEAKTFDKPEPDKKIFVKEKATETVRVSGIDQPGAMRAWNKAITDTTMVEDLNKTFIRERIAPADGGPAKMSETTRKLLEDYIADNTIKTFEFNVDEAKATKLDNIAEAKKKADGKLARFNAAMDEFQYAKAMEIATEEGWDPFSVATKDLADSVIDRGILELRGNSAAEELKAIGEKYGFHDDTVPRYYTLSSMVEVRSDGTTGLSGKFEEAFKKRYNKRFDAAIRAEGDLTSGERTNLLKEAVEKMDDYVSQQWRLTQRQLVDAGASELVDTDKMYEAIRGEMSNIVDQNKNNRCIVQILDNEGKYKFVELDPLVADLYRSRPYVKRGEDNFIRKISRWSRLGNVTLNPKSWINQTFKDPLASMIMAGWGHSVTTYQKEMAEMFGDQAIKYLQESMTEAGWTEFSKGLTDDKLKLEAVKTMTSGAYGAGAYAENLTQRELFKATADKGETSAMDVFGAASVAREQLEKGYSKSKAAAAKKNAFDKLYEFIETKTPGAAWNNWRETYFRKANFSSAFNDALKRGYTTEQARAIAELVSRNATTNFANTFMWGNWLCNDVPFLSAAINGSASFWRLFEMDPVGIMTRLNASALYLMAQTINSGQTVEDRKKLAAVPDYVKDSNMVMIYDGEVITIPLPEEVSKLLAPFRQAAEKMLGSENRSWVELLYNDALNISPISLDGFSTEDQTALTKDEGLMSRLSREAEVLISQCSPPIVETAIMYATGKDPYTGNAIDKSRTYFDEDGNMQVMDYSKTEIAKFIADKSSGFGLNISATMAEKLLENMFGTGFMWIAEDFYQVGQALTTKSLEPIKKVVSSSGESLIASPITVSDYEMLDQYDKDFKSIMKQLERQKNELLAPGGDYSTLVSRLSALDSSADNYETQKKNLTQQGLQMQEDFRKNALNLVNTYTNHYGSDYDGRKFASMLSLLNFNTPTMLPLTAKDFQEENDAYFRGREAAQQTMVDLGFVSPSDYSLLGVAKRNSQTGEVYVKFYSPTAILNASNSVFKNMAEGVNAEIAAAIDVAGIDRNEMYKGYYAAKAQGSSAAKQYKKDWNAKVVNVIAPVVNEYGAESVLGNTRVQEFLKQYIFVSNPYKTEDYLKDIFGVKE